MAQQTLNNLEDRGDFRTKLNAMFTELYLAITSGLDFRGNFDASGGAYPTSAAGGSGTAGAVLKADFWIISVGGTLPTGQVVEAGDWVVAKIDTPGNTQANWSIIQNNIGFTPQNIINTAVALTDAASMDLTAIKHTLTTSSATRTFTISYTGDDITIEVTLNATTSVFTFPASSLCISDGIASGDNTCTI